MTTREKMDVVFLKSKWRDVSEDCNLPSSTANKWWILIEEKYSEPTRFYHTLSHLEEMFRHFDTFRHKIEQSTVVALAIFFHDIIYDPQAADNEEQSIRLFEEFAAEASLEQRGVWDRVVAMIRATAGHQTGGLAEHSDTALFLDLDLAVLARDSQGYQQYASQIRQEYIHVPEADFRARRAQVLQSFLQRDRLYASPDFCRLHEATARRNLKGEIDMLEG